MAAALALVLAGDANAATSAERLNATVSYDPIDTEKLAPHPGRLLIGDGCGVDQIDAIERDWKVTINGSSIDVRVMQSFVIPDGDLGMVTFNAHLPSGARLTRLAAHTEGGILQGKIFDTIAFDRLSAPEFRNLARRAVLAVQNEDGVISTDAIINLTAAETVTLEYTYRIGADEAEDALNLLMVLNHDDSTIGLAHKQSTRGAVWVEWVGAKPIRLLDSPRGATVEKSGAQIAGLSWASQQLDKDARFQLAWAR
ncbi:MAG: hypothetical protein ABL931_09330 [Usitatibacteraceae bacterium]